MCYFFQATNAGSLWTQDPVDSMSSSGTTTQRLTPVLSSGMEAVKETRTSLRLTPAAGMVVSTCNYLCGVLSFQQFQENPVVLLRPLKERHTLHLFNCSVLTC